MTCKVCTLGAILSNKRVFTECVRASDRSLVLALRPITGDHHEHHHRHMTRAWACSAPVRASRLREFWELKQGMNFPLVLLLSRSADNISLSPCCYTVGVFPSRRFDSLENKPEGWLIHS